MSYDNINLEQLKKLWREKIDRLEALRNSLLPLLEDFDKIKKEFSELDEEMKRRLGKN
ncbi:MAG: hypothetical protein ACFFG0_18960 [Candidatus Thorarchaeota archaeon]